MVIVRVTSGMGNQMYQYALGRYLANKLGAELKIDNTYGQAYSFTHHEFYNLGGFNIQENLATPEELAAINPNDWKIIESRAAFDAQDFKPEDNIYLRGYWMLDEKIFNTIRDILLKDFSLRNPIGETSGKWRDKILAAECAVSIHVRMGDCLIPFLHVNGAKTLPAAYYFTCVERLKKLYPNLTLFVFSDDLQWAKDNFKFGVPIEFVEGCEHDYEEMYLMSICKHNITAQSSFGWWAAWLNQNPDKKVFTASDKETDGYISIPVDYSKSPDKEFPVSLSVIVYVDESMKRADSTLTCILSQQFKEFEVVIVAAGTEIDKRFANNPVVKVLNVAPSIGKHKAWNAGIDKASGDYVLLLTGNEFILPTTTTSFTWVVFQHFRKRIESKHIWVTFNTYKDVYVKNNPNVICSIQSMEENPAGIVNIVGVGKFAVRIDVPFKDLMEEPFKVLVNFREYRFAGAALLSSLVNKGMNNHIGTKFFKRSFLNENKIRFKENAGANADLIFLLDALLSTEIIVLTPALSYGQIGGIE